MENRFNFTLGSRWQSKGAGVATVTYVCPKWGNVMLKYEDGAERFRCGQAGDPESKELEKYHLTGPTTPSAPDTKAQSDIASAPVAENGRACKVGPAGDRAEALEYAAWVTEGADESEHRKVPVKFIRALSTPVPVGRTEGSRAAFVEWDARTDWVGSPFDWDIWQAAYAAGQRDKQPATERPVHHTDAELSREGDVYPAGYCEAIGLSDAMYQLGPDIQFLVEYDGFVGTQVGAYITREGKPGVVLQQIGTKVVQAYGRDRVKAVGSEA